MNDTTLQGFRQIAAAMESKPTNWQWIGPHLSRRMFGITQERAENYANRHGGEAKRMTKTYEAYSMCISDYGHVYMTFESDSDESAMQTARRNLNGEIAVRVKKQSAASSHLNRESRRSLKVAITVNLTTIHFDAVQIANNEHRKLDPSMYDWFWNDDYTEVDAVPVRWDSDSSYAAYQRMD